MNDLPFTTQRKNGTVDAWTPCPTGNYTEDCATGSSYFEELRPLLTTAPLMLSHVLQAMVEKGRVTGIEIGFLHALSHNV